MAETPPGSPPRTPPRSDSDPDSAQYWCHNCEKRVAVETLPDLHEIVCIECKDGFIEAVHVSSSPSVSIGVDLGDQFFQVIRLIAQAREQSAPPPPSDPSEDDYLRFELEGWDEEDEDEDEDDEDDEEEQSVVVVDDENGVEDGEEEEENDVNEPIGGGEEDDDEEEARRRRRDVLRLRLRDFATRAGSQRNRILDWAEILMGLEDHSIELRLHGPDSDTYVGNPGDYVDAAGYEALLQNLAESDGGRRGAPPASKSAVDKLENVVIEKEDEVMGCAICKDFVSVGEVGKNMPCGHGYHGECIVTWLMSRNSCPVCRFELPTDDVEYEEEKKKRVVPKDLGVGSTSAASVGDEEAGLQ